LFFFSDIFIIPPIFLAAASFSACGFDYRLPFGVLYGVLKKI